MTNRMSWTVPTRSAPANRPFTEARNARNFSAPPGLSGTITVSSEIWPSRKPTRFGVTVVLGVGVDVMDSALRQGKTGDHEKERGIIDQLDSLRHDLRHGVLGVWRVHVLPR